MNSSNLSSPVSNMLPGFPPAGGKPGSQEDGKKLLAIPCNIGPLVPSTPAAPPRKSRGHSVWVEHRKLFHICLFPKNDNPDSVKVSEICRNELLDLKIAEPLLFDHSPQHLFSSSFRPGELLHIALTSDTSNHFNHFAVLTRNQQAANCDVIDSNDIEIDVIIPLNPLQRHFEAIKKPKIP